MFRASSFAEGTPNLLVNYEMMSRALNHEVNDIVTGGNPYEAPHLYLDASPDLHLQGVKTANLVEAGAFSEAIFMLGLAKASRRVGAPTAFVVYPKTGHGIATPRLQREAAQRNLDWFRFWLLGEGSPRFRASTP
jgi:hypothetical protein